MSALNNRLVRHLIVACALCAATPGILMSTPDNDSLRVEVVSIKPGSNLTTLLLEKRIDITDSYSAISALKKVHDVDFMPVNQDIKLVVSESSRLAALSFLAKNNRQVELYRSSDGTFEARVSQQAPRKRIVKVSSTVKTSLFSAIVDQGVPQSTVMSLIGIYGDTLNLKKIRAQDQIELVFERFFHEDGRFMKDGKILYASIKNPDRGLDSLEIYRHVFQDGTEGYFDAKGRDIRSSSLTMPVDSKIRISSKFGWRTHPILGYAHFHKGIDFAVSYGTPVYAAGDGVVDIVGSKGGYGKYVRLKHSSDYATAYGHLSRFAKAARYGAKIKRGQIIAYSGSSGLATGPHLHYEVLYRGKPVNPYQMYNANTRELTKAELLRFKKAVKEMNDLVNGVSYASAG